MENKIFVGNISFKAEDKDLEKMFSEQGKITEVNIVKDRFSNRSKGFGFISFETEEQAKNAVEKLNGKDFLGRELKVSIAKPRRDSF